jgi:hypothetical protein
VGGAHINLLAGFDFFSFSITLLAEVLLKPCFKRSVSRYQPVITYYEKKWRKL